MNCKQGDLAIVIGARTPGLDGTIVEVLRPKVVGELFKGKPHNVRAMGEMPAWVCRSISGRPLPWFIKELAVVTMCRERAIADSILKPIRNNPGEDETLTWAGKPHSVKEKA